MEPSAGILLYRADPAGFLPWVAALRETLSAEERVREGRFRFRADGDAYTVSRGLLRRILGAWAGGDPRDVLLEQGPCGKPMLARGTNLPDIRFSMSRTDLCLLYAVTRGREVGVDVERIRPDFAWDGIVDRFFARADAERIRALPEPERAAAFFRCWTLKEAFLKGTGKGLSLPMDRADADGWSVRPLRLGPAHAAALAVEGAPQPVRLLELLPPAGGSARARNGYTVGQAAPVPAPDTRIPGGSVENADAAYREDLLGDFR